MTAALLCGALLAAAPRPVVVVPVVLSGDHALARELVREAQRVLAGRVELEPMSEEQLFVAAPELPRRMADCGSDQRCQLDALADTRAALALSLVLNDRVRPAYVLVRLFDLASRHLLGERGGALDAAERDPPGAVHARAEAVLTAAGFPAESALLLELHPPEAQVELAGARLDPETPARYLLRPGVHTVQVRAAGYVDSRPAVTLAPGETRKLAVRLEQEATLLSSPWFWAAAALGAAAITGAVLLARPGGSCVCLAPPGQECDDC